MELGPIQKAWIKSLKEHPERQNKNFLGYILSSGEYKACCLGEIHIIGCKMRSLPIPFYEGRIKDGECESTLIDSYKDYGLRSHTGYFDYEVEIKGIIYTSLTDMNDKGLTWPEIADYVEAHPENVFSESK